MIDTIFAIIVFILILVQGFAGMVFLLKDKKRKMIVLILLLFLFSSDFLFADVIEKPVKPFKIVQIVEPISIKPFPNLNGNKNDEKIENNSTTKNNSPVKCNFNDGKNL